MKTHLKIPFLALTLGLMAACAGQVEPPATLQPTIAALPTHIPVRFADDLIQTLAPGDILFQQDHEPGLIRPEVQFPFGRVAPFTLYADGTLIYLEEGSSFDEQQLMETSLSPAQSLALLQKLTDLGFGRLESHTDDCARQADGSSLCVADAATTILRGFLPGGQLHEVKIYHDFANDPQAFQSIQEVLNDYTHPDGRPYQPAVATLFLSPVDSTEGRTPAEWPLDEGWLTPMASGDRLVWFIEGEELRTFLSAAPRNMGDSYFEHAGRLYHAFLVPWLPDMDYKSEIQAEFQPPALDTRESTKTAPVTSRFADCPVPSTDPDTADFRIAFVR
ncbi:MAG: hypothetical protein GTO63_30480, partial [Anaerolineae bacterium]|nr:hypothetical protein [Anaerolineae bacterium]NIN99024.1 hypothetical protein [Anaerolineae bacterium]